MNVSPQSQPTPERRDAGRPPRKRPPHSDPPYGLAVALVAAFAVAHVLSVERAWLFNKDIVAFSRTLPSRDRIDIPMLLGSLAAKPTFASTFAWWHESWAKQAPYWRPLTMQSFWLEKRLFSLDRYDRWMWVSFTLGVVYAVLLGIYVRTVTGRRDLALLSVALFTVPIPLGIFQQILVVSPNDTVILATWKDQPDLWTNCLILAALILTHRRRYGWALACVAIAVCFKESGWLAFPLCFVQLIAARRLRELPAWVYGASVVVVLALIGFRHSAGPEVMRGYHMGSNHFWWSRYINALEGIYFSLLFSAFPVWLLGHAVYGGAVAVKRFGPARGMLCFVALGLAATWGYARTSSLTMMEALGGVTDPANDIMVGAALIALWLFAAVCLARDRPLLRWAAYFFVMGAISASTFVAASQVLSHALHLAMSFQSAIVAAALLAVWERLAPWLRKPFVQRGAATSSPA